MRYAAVLIVTVLLAVTGPARGASSSNILSNKVASTTEQSAERTQDPASGSAVFNERSSKAQDFAVFGLIGLGIIGLLWIRRHTSEL